MNVVPGCFSLLSFKRLLWIIAGVDQGSIRRFDHNAAWFENGSLVLPRKVHGEPLIPCLRSQYYVLEKVSLAFAYQIAPVIDAATLMDLTLSHRSRPPWAFTARVARVNNSFISAFLPFVSICGYRSRKIAPTPRWPRRTGSVQCQSRLQSIELRAFRYYEWVAFWRSLNHRHGTSGSRPRFRPAYYENTTDLLERSS